MSTEIASYCSFFLPGFTYGTEEHNLKSTEKQIIVQFLC